MYGRGGGAGGGVSHGAVGHQVFMVQVRVCATPGEADGGVGEQILGVFCDDVGLFFTPSFSFYLPSDDNSSSNSNKDSGGAGDVKEPVLDQVRPSCWGCC